MNREERAWITEAVRDRLVAHQAGVDPNDPEALGWVDYDGSPWVMSEMSGSAEGLIWGLYGAVEWLSDRLAEYQFAEEFEQPRRPMTRQESIARARDIKSRQFAERRALLKAKMRALRDEGKSIPKIAKELGVHTRRVPELLNRGDAGQ